MGADNIIMRDADLSTNWTAASDGTLESRHYYAQNRIAVML